MKNIMDTELVEELRAIFEYHPDGYLVRKENGNPCGQRSNHHDGYAHVKVNGMVLLAHRIIFAIVHGRMPAGQIDHINGNRMDNRIENLRDVSSSENSYNSKTNTSGFAGVCWDARDKKWRVYFYVGYRKIYLGLFENLEDAVQARKEAKIRYHPISPEAQKYSSEGVKLN